MPAILKWVYFSYKCLKCLIFKQACDCKTVVDHVSTPTASGVLRTSMSIQTRPDPIFSQPNDKRKKEVWKCDTIAN